MMDDTEIVTWIEEHGWVKFDEQDVEEILEFGRSRGIAEADVLEIMDRTALHVRDEYGD